MTARLLPFAALAAGLVTFGAPLSAQQATPAFRVAPAIPNFTLNGGLPKWQACRTKVLAGSANCKVLIIGESTPGGGVAFAHVGNDQRSGAWPTQLAFILRQGYGLNAQSNSIAGNSNSEGAHGYAPAIDQRVTENSWVEYQSATQCPTIFSVGACSFENPTNSTAFAFLPTDTTTFPGNAPVLTDTLEVWSVLIGTDTTVMQVNVNGGSALASISPGSVNSFTHTIVSSGASPANNLWNIVCSNRGGFGIGCFFQVLLARNSLVPEVSVINAGWAGATVVNWTTSNGVPQDPLLAIEAIAPDLCLIQDSGNDDAAGTNLTTYTNDMEEHHRGLSGERRRAACYLAATTADEYVHPKSINLLHI
jgi:hypothetical protein